MQIIPIFMWRQITDYLTIDDITKLVLIIDLKIDNYIDYYKSKFLNTRAKPFAVISRDSAPVDNIWLHDNFWSYVISTYTSYDTFNEATQTIDKLLYYRIFIGPGRHQIDIDQWCEYSNAQQVEITGVEPDFGNQTVIYSPPKLCFHVSYYMIIKDIIFDDTTCTFSNNDKDNRKTLYIVNCVMQSPTAECHISSKTINI